MFIRISNKILGAKSFQGFFYAELAGLVAVYKVNNRGFAAPNFLDNLCRQRLRKGFQGGGVLHVPRQIRSIKLTALHNPGYVSYSYPAHFESLSSAAEKG